VLVAGAFRTAYAHSQSPSTSTRHAAAIDTQQSDEVSRRQAHMSSVSCHVDELTADGRRQRRDVTQQHQQPTDVMSVRVVAKNIVLRSVSVKRGLRVFYPQNLGQDAQKMKVGGQRTHVISFMTHKFKLPWVTLTR